MRLNCYEDDPKSKATNRGISPILSGRAFNCRHFGIGVLEVWDYATYTSVRQEVRPEFARRTVPGVLEKLTPAQKVYAKAGNAHRQHWTPFKETCENVKAAVAKQPGLSMKELLGLVKTHYSSDSTARACLTRWIEDGKVSGVTLKRDGKYLRLYPA